MTLLTERNYYKPFSYPWAFEYYKTQQQMHWVVDEVNLADDLRDYRDKLTTENKILVDSIFRFFTQADVDVCCGYASHYLPTFKQPEVRMMLSAFASMEAVHQEAYSLLLETLGFAEDEYQKFAEHKAMLDKHEYLSNFGMDTPANIAKTLAVYSGFTEGVQLFSSFAILLNFPRHNLMKGMGQIVTWSIRDECVSADHEVLTPEGWVKFPELKDGQKVAQFDPETSEVSFVAPSRVVRKPYSGKLFGINKRHFSILATPNHDILTVGGEKKKFSEFTPHQRKKIPIAGVLNPNDDSGMSALERIMVAYAADGHKIIGKYRNGNLVGYQRVTFSFQKQRKIDRLKSICAEAGIVCDELSRDSRGHLNLAVNLPVGKALKSLHDWIDLSKINPVWAKDFLGEIIEWDGSRSGDKLTYCTTNQKDAELVQTIAHLSGRAATMIISEDNRKESYKTYYRVTLWDTGTTPSGVSTGKFSTDYEGIVYCVSVPTGCFLVKHDNKIHATGNSLHVEGMSRLFREFIQENPSIWTDELKYEIYCAAERTVELEDAFIDLCFDGATIPNLTPKEVKEYIRYIADRRLLGLGMKKIFHSTENPLPWLDLMINAVEHTNFFENRATEYARSATTGNWKDVFK